MPKPDDRPDYYKCTACDKTIIGNENQLSSHSQGKQHMKKLSELNNSIIMPQILRYRETNEPILGLEYIAELANKPFNHPEYVCVLCQVQENNIIDHLASSQHTEKYLVSQIEIFT